MSARRRGPDPPPLPPAAPIVEGLAPRRPPVAPDHELTMTKRSRGRLRRAAATAELAVLAPVLVFLMLIAVDFARIFYTAVTVSNCARNGP